MSKSKWMFLFLLPVLASLLLVTVMVAQENGANPASPPTDATLVQPADTSGEPVVPPPPAAEVVQPAEQTTGAASTLADSAPAASTSAVSASAGALEAETTAQPPPPPAQATGAANGKKNGNMLELTTGETQPTPAGMEVKSATGAINNLISITLEDVPVSDVVKMFSRISGANIIVSGVFTNTINADLKNVEWKTALRQVLSSINLSMIEDPSGIIMVVTSEMYQQKLAQIENTKPLITRTFLPKYLNAVDLIEQVKLLKILSPRGTIITSQSKEQSKANLKSSQLVSETAQNPSISTEIIITDIQEYTERVIELMRSLDKREPQVFIEARILDVYSDINNKLGFDWEMLDKFGASIAAKDLSWSFMDTHSEANAKIKKDNQFDNRANDDVVNKRYDMDGKQYEESTTTYEESPPNSGNWISITKTTPTRLIDDSIRKGRQVSSDKTDTINDQYSENKVGTVVMDVSKVALYLNALKRNSTLDLISHPLIIVGNRVEAKIHVGERYPTISTKKDVVNTGGSASDSYSETVEWNDLGLTLWVIPEIDRPAGIVRLTVSPSMKTWVKDIKTPQGSSYPVISTREVSSRVNVPSGQTVVIGGLMDNTKSKEEKRVWLLGDIPLLGLLFRQTIDVDKKSNLLILLTPTILDESAPRTGLEDVAQQMVDRLEKIPLMPKNAWVTNAAAAAASGQSTNLTEEAPTPSSSANIIVEPAAAPPAAGMPPATATPADAPASSSGGTPNAPRLPPPGMN